jgi:hypothetical protein
MVDIWFIPYRGWAEIWFYSVLFVIFVVNSSSIK